MGDPLRVLIVDGSEDDTALLLRELQHGGYDPVHERVDAPDAMKAALKERAWDLIIADYVVPHFGAMEALAVVKEGGVDVPLIVVSGKMGEDIAVEAMRAGAHDYVTKNNLSRLVPAIQRELREAAERRRSTEELERWQQDWEMIVQSIVHPVMILDPEFRVLAVNRSAGQWIGIRQEDAVGRHCYEVLHDAGMPPDGCPMQRLLDTGLRERVEAEMDMYGGISLISCTPVFDRAGRLTRVIHAATDITEHKRVQRGLREDLQRSQRSLYGMINTIATICEMKDPYTAGHQRGVSRVAQAVAEEMCLPQERIEGIRVAGLLHDIGKIFVPAEILSKPGRLTEHERSIMKTHAQTGYEVLKDIESPWPLAQAVLQHHERMDGSGYPLGLPGRDILLEARILGVADVVDAMSSHRPYRPALGIDKACDEIREHRGVLYDGDVADACLAVLSRERFDFGSSQEQAYREAIRAVTGGRLQLVESSRIGEIMSGGRLVASGDVKAPLDVPRARREVEPILQLPPCRKRAVLLCLSEALANVVKYAGPGKWTVWETGAGLRLAIEDSGPGIKLTELPKATLMQHYSTRESEGSGFSLMLYYSDRIYLATGRQGTSIVLEFSAQAKEESLLS